MVEEIERVIQEHPVFSYMKTNYEIEPTAQLKQYFMTSKSRTGGIPQTLTEFYKGFVHFLILDHISNHKSDYKDNWKDEHIRNIMQILSEIAFNDRFRKLKMNDAILRKYFLNLSTKNVDPTKADLVHMTFGLLVRDRSNRVVTFKFRDHGIQDYFCAVFQCQECESKWKKHKLARSISDSSFLAKHKHPVLPATVRDSVGQLPASGIIWRITFGLLSHDIGTLKFQVQLLKEVLQRSMYNIIMTSFDTTSLCIDLVYETQNRIGFAEYLEDFTMNQTVAYSNAIVSKGCVPYMLSSVAFLVNCAKDIFGLFFTRFGVTAHNIQYLIHPSYFLDTRLQVLNLSDNALGDEGVAKLQPLLLKTTSLTHLDMSKCNIGNDGMLYIAECTLNLPLISLNLSKNQIDDDGLKPFIRRLRYCGTMEILDLANNKLTDKSVIQLGHSLYNLPNLRGLDLRGNTIGENGLHCMTEKVSQLDKTLRVVQDPENDFDKERKSSKSKKNLLWQTKSLRKQDEKYKKKQGLKSRNRSESDWNNLEDNSPSPSYNDDAPTVSYRDMDSNVRKSRLRFSDGKLAESPVE